MLFHNSEKTETRHGNAPQVLFVARTTTAKYSTEVDLLLVTGLQRFHKSLIIVKCHAAS